LRVRATQRGQYGNVLRRVGDVFDVRRPGDVSAHWMVVVDATTPLVQTTARAAISGERTPVPLAGGARCFSRLPTRTGSTALRTLNTTRLCMRSPMNPTDDTTTNATHIERLYGHVAPAPATRPESESAEADALYDLPNLPPGDQAAIDEHEAALVESGACASRADAARLVTDATDAFRSAGIYRYHGVVRPAVDGLVARTVALARGTATDDDTLEQARREQAVAELRAVYGKDSADDLLQRISHFMARNPKLRDTVVRAGLANDPTLVRAIAEHVRETDFR
jgi:hypothetical protein